jgi:hypothetical protein
LVNFTFLWFIIIIIFVMLTVPSDTNLTFYRFIFNSINKNSNRRR